MAKKRIATAKELTAGPVEARAEKDTSLYSDTDMTEIVCYANAGTRLNIIGITGDWAMVLFGEVAGWTPADSLTR